MYDTGVFDRGLYASFNEIYLLENHYRDHGLKSSEYEVIASNPTVP